MKLKVKEKINNFAIGLYLAQTQQGDGVLNNFFKTDIGKKIFGIDPANPGDSPAAATDLGVLITSIIQLLLIVAGSIAVIYLILGGFRYVVSRGNEEATEAAKKTISSAIWGLVIIIMSFAIIFIISQTLITGNTGIQ